MLGCCVTWSEKDGGAWGCFWGLTNLARGRPNPAGTQVQVVALRVSIEGHTE